MNRNVLLILASGKSSRFDGFPKAFSLINDNLMNIENTINLAKKHFSKIYVCVNQETFEIFKSKITNVEMFQIVTGQGDADSLLKALRYISTRDSVIKEIMICWGDAVFIDDTPFTELLNYPLGNIPIVVGCSYDDDPYAWFDISNEYIIKSYFRNKCDKVSKGLHDQSIFYANLLVLIQYLTEYKKYLNLPDDSDEYNPNLIEMKLLNAIEYFASENFEKAKYKLISRYKVYSFNTQDDLNKIRIKLTENKGEKYEEDINY